MTRPVPLATDQPILKSEEDQFSRKQFSYRVAHTISHRSDPSSIVVGIYGAWGEGKTSVLRMIDEALEKEPNVKAFWFNPWRYRDEETLLAEFFRAMARELGTSISSKAEHVGGLLQRYKRVIAPVMAMGGAIAQGFSGVPAEVANVAGAASGQVGDLADGLAEVDAETLKARIDQRLIDSGTRLVVIIDDLDRLDQQEIQAVFRLVKLTLAFSNTAFVLAFDDEIVEQALAPQFGSASRKFLEKIIQVPLQLPRADVLSLRRFCLASVEEALRLAEVELLDEDARRFVTTFDRAILSRLATPRAARRYGNTLAFSLPLLKGEVDLVDLMLLEAARVFYPRLYSSIRDDRDLFIWSPGNHSSWKDQELRKIKRDKILTAISDLSERDGEAATFLIRTLFPRTEAVLSEYATSYSDETIHSWDVQRRITSPEYFDRYFSYGIPPNDISDTEFGAFAASLERPRVPAEIAEDLQRLVGNGRADRFLEKVRLAAQTLPVTQRGPLAIALSANSSLFPSDQRNRLGLSNLRESAALRVWWLVEKLPASKRFSTLAACLKATPDSMFALGIVRWLPEESEPTAPPRDEVAALRAIVVAKIREAAETTPAWRIFGRDTATVFWHWADVEGKERTSAYLIDRFTTDSSEALSFLESMLPNATDGSTGRPLRWPFAKATYDSVAALVDAEAIAAILRNLGFRSELGDPNEQLEGPPEERTARRFLALHEEAQRAAVETSEVKHGSATAKRRRTVNRE